MGHMKRGLEYAVTLVALGALIALGFWLFFEFIYDPLAMSY
jgi:hypothetical protein